MKTKMILFTLTLGASICVLTAQDQNPPRDGQRSTLREGGPSRERDGNGPAPTESLTDAQKAQVKVILSQ